MPVTDFATLLMQLRQRAKQKWPSLSDEELSAGFQAALGRRHGTKVKVRELIASIDKELTKHYGKPEV